MGWTDGPHSCLCPSFPLFSKEEVFDDWLKRGRKICSMWLYESSWTLSKEGNVPSSPLWLTPSNQGLNREVTGM